MAFDNMENVYDKIQVSIGHRTIFGYEISYKEIISILSKYPAFQWLDLLSKIEGFLLIKHEGISNPQIFLAQNLFPPSTMRRLGKYSAKKYICFSYGQLNYLRKLAIIYGNNESQEKEMLKSDISKAFLGIQDLHNKFDESQKDDPVSFYKSVFRSGYLNQDLDSINLLFRAQRMYIDLAQKFPFNKNKSLDTFFKEIIYLEVKQAMTLNYAFSSPFFQDKEKLLNYPTIIDPRTFFQKLAIDPVIINSIINISTIDFDVSKEKFIKELETGPTLSPIGYNLDVFRKTPLLKLNSGKIICANLSCLFQKTTQNLIWMPRKLINNLSEKEIKSLVRELTKYRGILFGEYVKELCAIMEEKNKKIRFGYIAPDSTDDYQEVGDSLLFQDNEMIIIEAKSHQFIESFKFTGNWDEDKNFLDELIKKASKQIQNAAEKIKKGIVKGLPIKPKEIKRIYPVILTYEPIPMFAKVQKFVRQKVREYGYLTDFIFAPLEVIYIGDLEEFIDCSDSLTLIEILNKKNSSDSHAGETNFNNFLANYVGINNIISNGWQLEQFNYFSKQILEQTLVFRID